MYFYICPKDRKIQDIREHFLAYVHDMFDFMIKGSKGIIDACLHAGDAYLSAPHHTEKVAIYYVKLLN